MEERKKLRSEVVAMQDKIKFIDGIKLKLINPSANYQLDF